MTTKPRRKTDLNAGRIAVWLAFVWALASVVVGIYVASSFPLECGPDRIVNIGYTFLISGSAGILVYCMSILISRCFRLSMPRKVTAKDELILSVIITGVASIVTLGSFLQLTSLFAKSHGGCVLNIPS
jgi:hypothetical protein